MALTQRGRKSSQTHDPKAAAHGHSCVGSCASHPATLPLAHGTRGSSTPNNCSLQARGEGRKMTGRPERGAAMHQLMGDPETPLPSGRGDLTQRRGARARPTSPPCWTAFQPMTTTGGTFVPHDNNEENVPQGPRFMNTSTQICKTGTTTSREHFFSGYHVPGRSLSLHVCELLTHTTTP